VESKKEEQSALVFQRKPARCQTAYVYIYMHVYTCIYTYTYIYMDIHIVGGGRLHCGVLRSGAKCSRFLTETSQVPKRICIYICMYTYVYILIPIYTYMCIYI